MSRPMQIVESTVKPASYPWLKVDLTIADKHTLLYTDPAMLYTLAQDGIKRMLVGDDNPDAPAEEKRLKQLVKTGIKGMFLTFGGKILDMLFQSKDHPKPNKGDDLIEWYSNVFAQIILTKCTEGTLVLKAPRGEFGDGSVRIDEIRTLTVPTNPTGPGEQGEGTPARTINPDCGCPQ